MKQQPPVKPKPRPTAQDAVFMEAALAEAALAPATGDVPVGCVIVRGGEVLAAARNTREAGGFALGHAELSAIDAACRRLGTWRLSGCTLYVTLEPCPMCAGAIVAARLDRVVIAARDPKAGAFGSVLDLNAYPLNHKPEIVTGVLAARGAALLSDFFAARRK